MKKELFREIEIPEEVEANIDGGILIVKGSEGENKKVFARDKLVFEKKDNKIIIGNKKATKKEKRMMNTIASHIKNMFEGVQKKFEYRLKICFSHFPMSVDIKGNEATVKNFLGEKVPRKTDLPENVEININKDIITIKSCDKEKAGQAAANFEAITKIRAKDRRIFQDGIFITSKAGKEI